MWKKPSGWRQENEWEWVGSRKTVYFKDIYPYPVSGTIVAGTRLMAKLL